MKMQDFSFLLILVFCQNDGIGHRGEDMVFRKEERVKEEISRCQLCRESKQCTLRPTYVWARQSPKEEPDRMGCTGLDSVRDLDNWQSVRLNQ